MVDYTIATQVRPFQMPNVAQIYGAAQDVQMNRMRMAEAQETAQERNALRGLMAAGVDLNTPDGLNQLRRAAPMLAPQFEQAASQRAYQTAQTARLRAQTDADRFKLYRGQLGGVNDQTAWDNWRGRVVQEFPQFAGSIPERFSPQARLDVAGGAELLIQRATAGAERAPVSVAAGSSLVDPRTGRVIYTAPARPQDQAPISVAPGNSVIDRAGNVIFTAPARAQDQAPISVAPGNSVIDRSGNVLFTAPERAPSPVSVAPGGTLVNPRTGEPVFTSPDRPPSPVSVAPGGTLVNPRTGEPVFTSPDRPPSPVSVAPGGTLVNPRTGEPVFTSPDRPPSPVSVAPGGTLVNPRTGEPVFTAPDRPRAPAEFERKRDEMIARGVPADIASGLATGQFRFSTATDGTMNVVDVGRGQVVFGPGAGGQIGQQAPATPPQGAVTPPQGAVTPPQGAVTPTARPLPPAGAGALPTTGADYRGATGAPGFVAEAANTIVDLFGGRALPAPEAARAAQALQNLDTRTRMFLQSAIPGRPSNYLMEMIGGLTVSPATLSLGPERSRERVQQTTRFLEATMSELENISRSRGTGQFTQQQIADANLTLNNLRSLLTDYRQLEEAFESGRAATPAPRARHRGTLDRGVQTGVQPPTAPGEFRTESGFRIRPIE
jgi:hypothetical protein